MPPYESLLPRLQAQDNGLAVLVALVAIGSTGIIAFQHRRPLRTFHLRLPSLFLILILGLVLRLPLMGESLWYDEAFTARIASLPLDALPAAIGADVHPPGYYLLVWGWSHLVGTSAVALRLPSLAFGLLSIYLVYRLMLAYGRPENEARLAALLLAVMPAAAHYGTEARSYTLLLCLVLAAMLAAARGRRWAFVAALAVIPWAHNMGMVYAGCLALGVVMQRRWWLPAALGLLGGSAWLPFAIAQASTISDGYWTYFTPAMTLWPLVLMTVGVVTKEQWIYLSWMPFLVSAFVSVYWWFRAWKPDSHQVLLCVILLVPLAVAVVSIVWQPVYVPRVLFVSMSLLVVPLGYGLLRSRLLLMLATLAVVTGLAVRYFDRSDSRIDYRSMVSVWCDGADYLYTTSIPAAFIFAANSTLPVLAWEGSEDDAGTFTPADLPLFQFSPVATLPPGRACIPQIDTPLHSQRERDYVSAVISEYQRWDITQSYLVDQYHILYFHRISVP